MKNFILLTIAFIVLFTACEKRANVATGISICLEEKIRQIEAEPVRNPPASIWQYQYKGQTVYYIPPYCCDFYGDLYDADCNLICHPDGGLSGGGDGKCADFFSTRTNEKLIWQDTRK